MANSLSISLSESFLEASSSSGDHNFGQSRRYYLPKKPFDKSIADYWELNQIGDVEKIFINLKAPRTILRKRLGNSPAVLVTEGFENWLDLNIPAHTTHFTLNPKRKKSPLNGDLIFGVNERTLHDGSIEKPIALEELEFLASKLKMSQVSSVAICFLHSNKNSENEVQAKKFFEEQGFRVFTHSTSDRSGNERHRWLKPILDAYLAPSIDDQLEQVFACPKLSEHKDKILFSSASGYISSPEQEGLSLSLGELSQLSKLCKNQEQKFFYFGFEDFFQLHGHDHQKLQLQLDMGTISLEHPEHTLFSLSPVHQLETNFWGSGSIGDKSLGYEPGPMAFGRGLKPTVFDLLWMQQKSETLGGIEPLQQLIQDKSKLRISDSLASLTKDISREVLNKDLSKQLLMEALLPIATQLSDTKENIFMGPFSKIMKTAIEELFGIKSIQLFENFDYCSSMAPLMEEH